MLGCMSLGQDTTKSKVGSKQQAFLGEPVQAVQGDASDSFEIMTGS